MTVIIETLSHCWVKRHAVTLSLIGLQETIFTPQFGVCVCVYVCVVSALQLNEQPKFHLWSEILAFFICLLVAQLVQVHIFY